MPYFHSENGWYFDNGYSVVACPQGPNQGTLAQGFCQHEFTVACGPYGQAVQGACRKCGFLPPPGYTTAGSIAPTSSPLKTYSDEEIERIKTDAYLAGVREAEEKAKAQAELWKCCVCGSTNGVKRYADHGKWRLACELHIWADEKQKDDPADPMPLHRAIANHHRVGNVYAHRAYWLPRD